MSDAQHQQAEYDAVNAQIRERMAELKAKEIPKKLKNLIQTVHLNRLHPLLREVVSRSEDQTSFMFNGNPYSVEFKAGRPFSVPTGPRLCLGTLTVRTNSDVVLESSFEATEDEFGLEFYYQDTAIYRRGNWVDELLTLEDESNELREAQQKAYFQSKDQLASLRDKFAIPEPPPLPVRTVKPKS
jgi:hypothetical protein